MLLICSFAHYQSQISGIFCDNQNMRCVPRGPVFGISDQVQHKPGCAVTDDGERLDILDLRRGIVLSVRQKQRLPCS